MSVFLLLSLLQPVDAPVLPADWSVLPEAQYRGGTSGVTLDDVMPVMAMSRQCRFRRVSVGMRGVTVQSAVLVGADGRLLAVVPDRSACEPLRSYLARLYPARLAGRLVGSSGEASSWYRISTTFSWSY